MRHSKMTPKEIDKELSAIVSLWSNVGRRKPDKGLPKSKSENDDLRETIDYLRVCVKYTLFDLSACHREINALRKRIKELGGMP